MKTAEFISSIHHVNEDAWNLLCPDQSPFIQHAFFACLEDSGSTSKATGWQPHHLLIKEDATLVAAVPLFIKSHSYGEYMFDWAWAQAYHQHGIEYYPKLLNALPFTPATDKRWLLNNDNDESLLSFISNTIINESLRLQCSSCHCLFPNKDQSNQLKRLSWLQRTGYQYHWFNENYTDFSHFIEHMSSRKRKNIIKEREKITAQEITIVVKEGHQISNNDWQLFYHFYQDTYLKRSGHTGYLSLDFFLKIGKSMTDAIVMIQAEKISGESKNTIAAALFFKNTTTLYGRYWGCHQDYDSLHFELCYYQGIEYATTYNMKKFDAGAQGEHKIKRGFKPVKTWSNHWIHHQAFSDAIKTFITAESEDVEAHILAAKKLLPFKKI